MDWYYPVLGGAISGSDALAHLDARWDEFVITNPADGAIDGVADGGSLGVRCVSDKHWATAAETSECAMAYLLAGDRATATDLFRATLPMRQADGRYLTGIVYPDLVTFPTEECSTYTSAAVVLAADALGGCSPASGVFVDHRSLPDLIAVDGLPLRTPVTEND